MFSDVLWSFLNCINVFNLVGLRQMLDSQGENVSSSLCGVYICFFQGGVSLIPLVPKSGVS